MELVLYSFWLPQIAACVRHDARQPLMPAYVLGMSASRLALPLYLHGCPHNLLRVPPSRGFCLVLVLYVGAQVRERTKNPKPQVPNLKEPSQPAARAAQSRLLSSDNAVRWRAIPARRVTGCC